MIKDRGASRASSVVFDADGISKPWAMASIFFICMTSASAIGASAVAHQGLLVLSFVFLLLLTGTAAVWLITHDLRAAELALKRQFPPYDPDWRVPYLRGDNVARKENGSADVG